MISRVWHGWTTPGNADAYESLLKDQDQDGHNYRLGFHQVTSASIVATNSSDIAQ
jgi:hypothetical protein